MGLIPMLKAERNVFDGFTIDPKTLPEDEAGLLAVLQTSLQTWREEGGKLVWMEISAEKAQLIPVALQAGFQFHHTEGNNLIVTYSLAPDAFIPVYATHYIGAGGVVVNDAHELLVICEKAHRMHRPHYYKLPGGALLPGEHLVDGVIREVFEETGIRTRFVSLMCFRHWHGYRYGKSDIYFICRLDPLSIEILLDETEIEECMWMPVDTYLNLETVGLFNKRVVSYALQEGGLIPSWFDGYEYDQVTREIFVPRRNDIDG